MRLTIARSLVPICLAVFMTACESNTEPGPPCADPQGGMFEGNASGIGSLRGCGSYGVTGSASQTTVVTLTAGDPSSPTPVLSLVRSGVRPAAGSYSVGVNAGNFGGSILLNGKTYGLSSGTVTISASSSGELQGSVNVTGSQSGAGGSATITGTFTAVCAASGSVTC